MNHWMFGLDVRILEFDDLFIRRWFIKGPLRHLKKKPEDYKYGFCDLHKKAYRLHSVKSAPKFWQVLGGPVPFVVGQASPRGNRSAGKESHTLDQQKTCPKGALRCARRSASRCNMGPQTRPFFQLGAKKVTGTRDRMPSHDGKYIYFLSRSS